jgi:hypothetical protein
MRNARAAMVQNWYIQQMRPGARGRNSPQLDGSQSDLPVPCECLTILRHLPWSQRRHAGRRDALERAVRRGLARGLGRPMRGRGGLAKRLERTRVLQWVDGPQVNAREIEAECSRLARCWKDRCDDDYDTWRAHLEARQHHGLAQMLAERRAPLESERSNDELQREAIDRLWREAAQLGWDDLWKEYDRTGGAPAAMACRVLGVSLRTLRTAGASWSRARGVRLSYPRLWNVELALRPQSERVEDWDVDNDGRPMVRAGGVLVAVGRISRRRPRWLTDAMLEDSTDARPALS